MQNRKRKTRRKIATSIDDLKGFSREKLVSIIHNNGYHSTTSRDNIKVLSEMIIDKAMDINKKHIHQFAKAERNIEEHKNIQTKSFNNRQLQHNLLLEYIEKQKGKKYYHTQETYIKINIPHEIYEWFVSNYGNLKKINKRLRNERIKPIKYVMYIGGTNTSPQIGAMLVAKHFYFGYKKKNNDIFHIDGNKNNNHINNLLILPKGSLQKLSQSHKQHMKGKKGSIELYKKKKGNTYSFRYMINKNRFGKTFKTLEEAKQAQQEYIKHIDDIENPLSETKATLLFFHKKKIKRVEDQTELDKKKYMENLSDINKPIDKMLKRELVNYAFKRNFIKHKSQGGKMKKKELLKLIKEKLQDQELVDNLNDLVI
jgi:hypothetical protein